MLTQEHMEEEWDLLGYPTSFNGVLFRYGMAIESIANQEKDRRIAFLESQINRLNDALKLATASHTKCDGCNGHGMVGNILDSETCPFCKGSGLQPSRSQVSDAVFKAAIKCGHRIDDYSVTLFQDSTKPGNALSQLADRLIAATKGGE